VVYRDNVEVLRARQEELRIELARIREEQASAAMLETRRQEIERELDRISRLVSAHAGPSGRLLDGAQIASPCAARWDDMIGTDTVRFCGQCRKNVYDLSTMTRDEAERFLVDHTGGACVRLFRRADGTVMTSDCPEEGRRRRRLTLVKHAAAVAIGATLAGLAAAARDSTTHDVIESSGLTGLM
jgi:hypothetical protein